MTWTLTLTPMTWIISALLVLVGGKLLQQGGRMYGEGRSWEVDTLAGVACQLALIFGGAIALLEQNAQ